jgi:protein-tyrosine phosphatase
MNSWSPGAGIVEFPDGRRVRGRGLRVTTPETSGELPDIGFYLLGKEPPPIAWPSVWIPWPDFRLPESDESAYRSLADAFDRAATERVELACEGGRGRTGTALAVLAVLAGVAPEQAVEWVRAAYSPKAVETPWQKGWIRNLDAKRIRAAG